MSLLKKEIELASYYYCIAAVVTDIDLLMSLPYSQNGLLLSNIVVSQTIPF